MDESDTIRKAQGGDEEAITSLFRGHISNLKSVAFKILKNEEDAEEMASDAFMEGIKTFDPDKGAKFSTWLHKITMNACISKLRKSKKHFETVGDENFELLLEKERKIEWLPGKDGTPSPENVEDLHKAIELTRKEEDYIKEGVNLLDDFLRNPLPGQSFYDWYEDEGAWRVLLTWGDHYQLLGINWEGPSEPIEIDNIRKRLKGISPNAIAKKGKKSIGAVHAETHKLRKKFKK